MMLGLMGAVSGIAHYTLQPHGNRITAGKSISGRVLILLWLLLDPAVASAADDLLSIYRDALGRNAAYLSMQAESEAKKAEASMAWSRLLPSLSASASKSSNRADRSAPLPNGRPQVSQFAYAAQSYSFNLKQPLYHLEMLSIARQADHLANASGDDMQKSAQELAVRVVASYCEALYAGDQLRLVLSQQEAVRAQFQAATLAVKAGSGTRIDVDDAKSKLDLIDAQKLDAEDKIEDALEALSAMIGRPVLALESLIPSRMELTPPTTDGLDEWVRQAEAGSFELASLREQVNAAESELSRVRSGHLPTIDLVASTGTSTNDNLSQLSNAGSTEYRTSSLGVQISLPIFSGGYVSSDVTRALAKLESARHKTEEARRNLVSQIMKEYGDITHGVNRIRALERAALSAETLAVSSQKGVAAGTRTLIDVLEAKQQLNMTLRDLAEARYKLLISRFRLLSLVGRVDVDEVTKVNAWFSKQALVTDNPVLVLAPGTTILSE